MTDETAAGVPRVLNYENDAYGQVLVREERDGTALGPRQLYYYFNGHRIGDVGNNGVDPSRLDYAQTLARSGAGISDPKGGFRAGHAVSSADFDANYQPINAGYPGGAAGGVTVQTGDTLSSIAQTVWGDAALWYLIADANGVTNDTALVAGQRLIIPNKVTNFHNNSSTFRVYNPGEAIGDTLPTLPAEPAFPTPRGNQNNCGGFGQILLVAVAAAVAYFAGPAVIGLLEGPLGAIGGAIVGGAITGAAASVASQTVGLATGIQNKFDWKGVGLAAIGGAVGGGLGLDGVFKGGAFSGVGSKVAGDVLRGALSNALTQGIGVATGLQDSFDWVGVAAAGIGGGLGGKVGRRIGFDPGQRGFDLGNSGLGLLSGMAGGIANAATRSVIQGTDFGDNIMAVLPDVIGNTIGNLVAGGIARIGRGDINSDLVQYSAEERAEMVGSPVRIVDIAAGAGAQRGSLPNSMIAGGVGTPAQRIGMDPYNGSNSNAYSYFEGDDLIIVAKSRFTPSNSYDAAGVYWTAQAMFGSSFVRDLSRPSLILPWARSDYGPVQQYMLGDGSTSTGTSGALDRYNQQRESQSNLAYIDRVRGGTISGIALGISNKMGASSSTQDFFYGLGSSADGLLIAGGSMAGARVPGIGNQLSLNIVNGENGTHANSRLSGRTTYLYELQTRGSDEFLKYGISVNPDTRYSNSFMADKRIFRITSGTRADMLALEREMVISNPGPLNNEPWAVKARRGN